MFGPALYHNRKCLLCRIEDKQANYAFCKKCRETARRMGISLGRPMPQVTASR